MQPRSQLVGWMNETEKQKLDGVIFLLADKILVHVKLEASAIAL